MCVCCLSVLPISFYMYFLVYEAIKNLNLNLVFLSSPARSDFMDKTCYILVPKMACLSSSICMNDQFLQHR